jgi:hypothetical protein
MYQRLDHCSTVSLLKLSFQSWHSGTHCCVPATCEAEQEYRLSSGVQLQPKQHGETLTQKKEKQLPVFYILLFLLLRLVLFSIVS